MAPNKQTSFFLFITPPLKAAKDAKLQLFASTAEYKNLFNGWNSDFFYFTMIFFDRFIKYLCYDTLSLYFNIHLVTLLLLTG